MKDDIIDIVDILDRNLDRTRSAIIKEITEYLSKRSSMSALLLDSKVRRSVAEVRLLTYIQSDPLWQRLSYSSLAKLSKLPSRQAVWYYLKKNKINY